MNDIDSEPINKTSPIELKLLVKGSFYSIFTNYGNLIFQLIASYLLARILSQELWGILIIAISFIAIISVISSYFPPAIDYTINYYIPRFMALNQSYKIKTFIKTTFILKILFLIPIFIFSILIFKIFTELFIVSLRDNIGILYILSPVIFIMGLNPLINGIYRSFDMYKTIFLITIITTIFQIIAYLLCLLFVVNISLELIAIINLLTFLIPFIINCVIVIGKLHKLKLNKKEGNKCKKFYKYIFKYGFPLSFGYLVHGLWDQIQLQGIGSFSPFENVVGYNISIGYSAYSEFIRSSFYFPLFATFTRLNAFENHEQINKLYNLINKYLLFLISLTSGLFYFLSDFFLFFIYGESYLVFSFFLKYLMISKIFRFIYTPFDALLLAKNKLRYFPLLKLIQITVYMIPFFIGLVYYGVLGSIIGIIMGNIGIMILYVVLSFRIFKIKLDITKIGFQFFIFFVPLVITLILENLWLNKLNFMIIQFSNLSFFRYLPFLSIFSFLIIFIILNVLFKTFSRTDFEYLESIFNRDMILDKLIKRILRIFKK